MKLKRILLCVVPIITAFVIAVVCLYSNMNLFKKINVCDVQRISICTSESREILYVLPDESANQLISFLRGLQLEKSNVKTEDNTKGGQKYPFYFEFTDGSTYRLRTSNVSENCYIIVENTQYYKCSYEDMQKVYDIYSQAEMQIYNQGRVNN